MVSRCDYDVRLANMQLFYPENVCGKIFSNNNSRLPALYHRVRPGTG